MKAKFMVMTGVVAGVALIALADGTPTHKDSLGSSEIQALRNEVTELRTRVQQLEDREKNLESTVANLNRPHMTPLNSGGASPLFHSPVSPVLPASSETDSPKIWGERKVNGWTFYIVPCEQRSLAGVRQP